jgi:DNA-binding transcriptional ArsR family regulator
MESPFEEIANLDKLIHEPARLAILTALSACESADFLFLKRLTGLSDGNLSSHITKLEEADLVKIQKQFIDKKPSTEIQITSQGIEAIQKHWEQLGSIKKNTAQWKKDQIRK